MRLATLALALHDPADERCGDWSREELEAQNERFASALERAFELGLECRESARREVKLPTSSGARFVAPLTKETQEGLWRSSAASALVFVARG